MNEVRNRYLRDRVMTASPAQRVVLLFDRLVIDIERARAADEAGTAAAAIGHASQIVAELLGSLDLTAGGPAQNLSQLYGFLLNELIAARGVDGVERLGPLLPIVTDLRDAFAFAAASTASTASTAASSAATATASLASAAAAPPGCRMDRLIDMPDDTVSTWHTLLDGVEYDVQLTENWLIAALTSNGGAGEVGARPELGLMPDLAGMQPLPSELLPRIARLRERVLRVSADLERAMAANRRQRDALPTGRPVMADRTPLFVDRSV